MTPFDRPTPSSKRSTLATLAALDVHGWQWVFGKVEVDAGGNGGAGKAAKLASMERAAAVVTRPTKPWLDVR